MPKPGNLQTVAASAAQACFYVHFSRQQSDFCWWAAGHAEQRIPFGANALHRYSQISSLKSSKLLAGDQQDIKRISCSPSSHQSLLNGQFLIWVISQLPTCQSPEIVVGMFQLLVTVRAARTQSLDNTSKCAGTNFVPSDLLFGSSQPSDNNLYRYVTSLVLYHNLQRYSKLRHSLSLISGMELT